MTDPHCYESLQLCAMRIAKLNSSGSPLEGAANGYVTSAPIQATVGVELEEGDEFTLKNGCGAICATFKDCDRVKRVNVDMELCHLDSELLGFLTGGTVFYDLAGTGSGDPIGYMLPGSEDACPNGVSLELWTKAWDGGEQAAPPFLGGSTVAYFHFVFPKVKFQMGEFTLENEIMRVPVTGFGEENSRITSNGPFDDWPADIASYGGITNVGGWFLDATLPDAVCGAIEVTSAAS